MGKPLNIGMIGYGFMGRAHSNAYRKVSHFFDLQLSARPQGRLRPRRRQGQGVRRPRGATNRSKPTGASWSNARTSTSSTSARRTTLTPRSPWRRPQAGKMILCEKPLAMNGPEGLKMVEAVEKAGVPNMVWYNYRRVPAVTLAKQLIDEGRLGKIFHYRAKFLQDWTINADLPQGGAGLWRLDVAAAGSGVTGDLLAHCIDTALWLNGGIGHGQRHDRNLRQGTQAQPHRQGRKGRHRRRLHFHGPLRQRLAGDLRIDPLRPRPQGPLHLRDQRRACIDLLGPARPAPPAIFRSPRRGQGPRLALDPRHRQRPPYMGNWWVPGLQIGYEHSFVHQVADFIEGVETGKPAQPDFRNAYQTQLVLDAVLASAKDQKWVNVAKG